MPSLSIYDTEGNRCGTAEGEQSERVRRLREVGGRLMMDISGETTRIIVAFEARNPVSGSSEQYYAVYSGNPRQLHRGLRRRLRERHDLALVTGEADTDTVYDLFVPNSEIDEPAETDRLDSAAALLSDPEETDQVRVGTGSDRHALQAVRYFLSEGYTGQVAVTETVDVPELSGFGLVVEIGAYEGVELLSETAAGLGGIEATEDADGSSTREQERGQTTGAGQQSETSPADGRAWLPSGLGDSDERQRTAVLLGVFGALALVVVLALGTALGGGIPFVGGDGGEAVFEASIAETNEPVVAGEAVAVEVTVTNTGETSGTGTVTVDAEELGGDSVTVSLAAGASTTELLPFETGPGDTGLYTLTATSNGSSDTALVTVEAAPEAVRWVSPGQTRQSRPEALVVTAEVTNTGDADGTVELSAGALGTVSTELQPVAGASATETLAGATRARGPAGSIRGSGRHGGPTTWERARPVRVQL